MNEELKTKLVAAYGCLIGLVGIAAAVVMLKMLKILIAQEQLSILGWLVLIASSCLFLGLFAYYIRWIDPKEKEYLLLIERSGWLEEPLVLPASAVAKSKEWIELLSKHGLEVDLSEASLPDATRFLRENSAQILGDPPLLAQAAAYYGEVFVKRFKGKWKLKSKAGYRDASVHFWSARGGSRSPPAFSVFASHKTPRVRLRNLLITTFKRWPLRAARNESFNRDSRHLLLLAYQRQLEQKD